MISTRRAWVLFSNASHTSCTQWVTATTGHCYLITNKRDVPSVRFQKFPAKQTAISASQTLALLSTGGAYFVPGFTHHLALQSNFPLSGQASSWSGDNFETTTVRKQERDRDWLLAPLAGYSWLFTADGNRETPGFMEQGRLALAHKSPRGLDYSSQHSLSHLPFQPQVQELPCRNPHTCCHHRDNWTKRKKCKSRRVSVTLSQTHKEKHKLQKKKKERQLPTRQEPVCLNMLSLMWSTCNRQQPAQKHYSFPIGSTTEHNVKTPVCLEHARSEMQRYCSVVPQSQWEAVHCLQRR